MKKSLKWSRWMLGLSLLGIGIDAQAVNLYLRSGSTTCIYNTNASQTLQKTSGTNQASIAFSAKTNAFSFYSAVLTNSASLSSSRTATGTMGVQNNGNADFQFQASEILYDYNPATGSQVQIVAGSASSWVTVTKNGKTGRASLPGKSVGGSGYTIPAGHMLKAVVTVVVNISTGINGALIYNAGSGDGKSLVQFPKTSGFVWPFGNFATAPDVTIIAPASVAKNSTGNIASVRDAGAGAAYSWTITNGTITAGQTTRQITWTAGSAGSVGLGVTVVSGCASSGSASVIALNAKTNQTITFNSIPAHTYGDAPFTLSATASSGLPITFTVSSGPATVSGGTLTMVSAGTVIVDATQAGNASYNPAIAEQSFIVNPKALTVSGITASNKVYDGATDAELNTNSATLAGVLAGDVVTLDTTFVSGDFADETVGSGKTVNVSDLDIIGADEGKYTLVDPTTTADITAAELTVSGITANDKVYDGTTTVTLNIGSAILVGAFSNDVVSLNTGSAAGTFATTSVGATKAVTVSGLTLGGADAGNYTLTQPTAAASITVRTLTMGATAANKVYDGTATATVALSDNRVAGDSLGTSFTSASFADKNVGNGKTVNVSGISVGGMDAGNYSFNTTAGATANITTATLTITAAANTKTYDGSISAAATPTTTGLQGSDSVSGLVETYDTKNAGTGKTLSVSAYTVNDGNGGNNYTVNTAVSTAGVIIPASGSITLGSLNQTYDGSAEPATATTTPNGLVVTFTYNGSATVPTTADSYTVVGTINDANYQGSATGTLAIAPAPLTITATPNTKTYDGTVSAAAMPTVSGLQGSDSVTGLAEAYDTKDAGNGKTLSVTAYTINDGNAGANYTVNTVSTTNNANAGSVTGVITPATLTVTVDSKTRICGMPNPLLTASYNGFVGGESVNVLSSPVILSTTATTASDAGTYPITADGAATANYTIHYVNGTLKVVSSPQLAGANVSVNGTQQYVLSFPTVAGLTYQLEYSTDLGSKWTPLGAPFAGTDGIVTVTNSISSTPQCFFRLGIQ